MLITPVFLSLLTLAAAETPLLFNCAPQVPPAICSAKAAAARLEKRAVDCNKITGALSGLKKLGGPATAFCSGFLKIPTATTTTTTLTPATSTATNVVTITQTSTVVTPIGFKKRAPTAGNAVEERAYPGDLGKYALAEISSACKCLNLGPKTTKTVTTTAPTPVTTVFNTATLTTTITTCTTPGGPCDCFNPGACCNAGCSCNDFNGNPVSTCF